MVAIFSFLLIIVIVLAGAGIILYRRQARKLKESQQSTRSLFRWSYILLPLVFLVVSIITAAYYYGKLPAYNIPYRFDISGAPDAWAINPLPVVAIDIGIQVILVLVSVLIVLGSQRTKISAINETTINPGTIIAVMGNMPAILQFIAFFYTLDIFKYATSQTHLLPMWLFLVIILALITVAFLAFAIVIGLKAIRQPKS